MDTSSSRSCSIVTIGGATAVLAMVLLSVAAGSVAAQDVTSSDADSVLVDHPTRTYYQGQKLIYTGGFPDHCPEEWVVTSDEFRGWPLDDVRANAELSGSFDQDCRTYVETSGLDSGTYVIHKVKRDRSGDLQISKHDTDRFHVTAWSGSGQFPPGYLEIDAPEVVRPGTNFTVGFRLTSHESERGFITQTDVPASLTVVDRNERHNDGVQKDGRWLYQDIVRGNTETGYLVLKSPHSAGISQHNISGTLKTAGETIMTQTTTVHAVTNASLCDAVAGVDGSISDNEILKAIQAWHDDEPVPGTGTQLPDKYMLGLIEAWRDGKNCGQIGLPAPNIDIDPGSVGAAPQPNQMP